MPRFDIHKLNFLMIKVRSCKVSGKFTTGAILPIVPRASALNELDV